MSTQHREYSGHSFRIPSDFCVFCDLDGTLIDTDRANYLSYRRAVKVVTNGTYDVDCTPERLNRETLKKRLPSLIDSQLTKVAAYKEECFTDFLSETRLNVDLARTITDHCDTNQFHLVTHCREARAIQLLDQYKLLNCFAQLICRECLNPDLACNKYEAALALTGAQKDAIIVFENEEASLKQAMRAGMPSRNIYRVAFIAEQAS